MKAMLKVVKITDRKDGSCDVKIDANKEGRRRLMEAGLIKVMEDFLVSETHKLSLIDKLKICWSILK
mgnify:FL=1